MKDIWIGVIGALGGALIGVVGQIIGNLINHKKEIERIKEQKFYEKKIEFIEELSKIIEHREDLYSQIGNKILFYEREQVKKVKQQLKDEISRLVGECSKGDYINLKVGNSLYIENKDLIRAIGKISMHEMTFPYHSEKSDEEITKIKKVIDKLRKDTREIIILMQKELRKKNIIIPVALQNVGEDMEKDLVDEVYSQMEEGIKKASNKSK